jgi:hypothetical protein
LWHKGVGISVLEACKKENSNKVKECSVKYQKEFKGKGRSKTLNVGDSVLKINEFKRNKLEDEFGDIGTIVEKVGKGVYVVDQKNLIGKVKKKKKHV